MSLHQLLVLTFTHVLDALSAQLDKAVAQGDADALFDARLAEDMLPLSAQVRFVCVEAHQARSRLTGAALPEVAAPTTVAEAKAALAEARDALAAADPAAFDAAADRALEFTLPNGMTFALSGRDYLRDWAFPQLYFHAVTAYAILRHKGVPLGKADVVPHMLGYLRR